MAKQISLAEVKKHNKEGSVWMVIHNNVYDVTAFLNEHPGGADALLEVAGTDSTQAFEDVGHSEDARELLKKYKIGEVPAGEAQGSCKKCAKAGNSCDKYSCTKMPVKPEKTWRKFDNPTIRTPKSKSQKQTNTESRDSQTPEQSSTNRTIPIKYAVIALAGAIIIGFLVKKALASRAT